MTSTRRAALFLFLTTFIWGSTFTVVKIALHEVSPSLFMAARFAVGLLIASLLWPSWWRGLTRTEWIAGAVIGFFLWLGFVFQTVGLGLTSASNSAFLTGLFVVITPLVAWVWEREHPGGLVLVALAMACCGLFFMTRPDLGRLNLGDLLNIGAAVAFAFEVEAVQVYSRKTRWASILALSFCFVLPVSLLTAPLVETPMFHPGPLTWGIIVYCGAMATTVALGVQYRWQHHLPASRAGIIYVLEPVIASIIAAIFLGERFEGLAWVGALLILAAMFISEVLPGYLTPKRGKV